MDRTKKILISMLVLGALAAVGAGTYATFNATTVNSGNTFSTGTLLLSNTQPSGTVCLSTAVGLGAITAANSGACSAFYALDLGKPGTASYANLTLKNTGSLAATALTVATSACATTNRATETTTGTGDMCATTDAAITEVTGGPTTFAVATTVAVANGASPASLTVNALPVAIAASATINLMSPTGATQTATVTAAGAAPGATSIPLAGFTATSAFPIGTVVYIGSLNCVYPAAAAGLCAFDVTKNIGTATAGGLANATPPTLAGGLAAGANRFFIMGLQLPSTADNTFQGRTATFTMTWVIQ